MNSLHFFNDFADQLTLGATACDSLTATKNAGKLCPQRSDMNIYRPGLPNEVSTPNRSQKNIPCKNLSGILSQKFQ